MNLKPLFEKQQELRDRINYQGADRFEKLVLALLVEIGECANEWRGFKFWSTDQEPRTFAKTTNDPNGGFTIKNPLLEEYVDGLHFVLELGLEHEFDPDGLAIEELKFSSITRQFTALFQVDWDVYEEGQGGYYHEGLELYIGLGEMLGFTWKQVEAAYMEKNAVNHKRQEDGY
ncbi:hypothetical protein CGZ90_00725 [Fictibacillus aquaticus]|uniref:dUTPase n=1 Tax=Fictibacillus aquaticus TaxID=2021314 RepID=A0A235FAX6_9BACL|nr:hypothetical protein CGZ90_00725 [Fictibacillus aquaticus]